jgi:predicted DNA-binding transcriptional regulator AlpA
MKHHDKVESSPTKYVLPETGFVRVAQIVGKNGHPPIIPIGETSWWNGVKSGKYPKPIKLGTRTTVWRIEDIRSLIEGAR